MNFSRRSTVGNPAQHHTCVPRNRLDSTLLAIVPAAALLYARQAAHCLSLQHHRRDSNGSSSTFRWNCRTPSRVVPDGLPDMMASCPAAYPLPCKKKPGNTVSADYIACNTQ